MRIGHRELAEYQYAVLNPMQLEQSQWIDLPTVALTPAGLSTKVNALPRLLDLTALDLNRRTVLLERADTWDANNDFPFLGLLLKSTASSTSVSAHLVRQLVVTAPDSSQALLRWYDPRVFRHLCWLLTPGQMRTLSGPVSTWSWPEPERPGNWLNYDVSIAETTNFRLKTTSEQWAEIGRIGVINRTVSQLLRNAPDLTPEPSLFRSIDTHLKRAYDHHGLTNEADARLFAEHAIRHPQIHQHPEMAQRLEQARQGEVTYVGACADMTHDKLFSLSNRHRQRKDAVT